MAVLSQLGSRRSLWIQSERPGQTPPPGRSGWGLISAGAALVLVLCGAASRALGDGRSAFNNYCRTCHSLASGDNRLGPSLYGIVGSRAGSVAGFSRYSESLRTSSIIWDELTLDRFIADPESVVQTNNMKPFGGIADAAVRAQIVEFLKQPREVSR